MFIVLNNGIFESCGMSGSDQRALQWSQFFKKKNSISIITSYQGLERYQKAGFLNHEIITTGHKKSWQPVLLFYLWQIFLACKKLKNVSCRVIYSSSDTIADALPAFYKKMICSSVKWVAGCHLIWPHPFKILNNSRFKGFSFLSGVYFYYVQTFLFFCFKKWASMVLVSNEVDKNYLIQKGVQRDKILITPGAIRFSDIERSPKGEIIYDACFIGRNHPQKGIQDLFLIWKEVVLQKPKSQLAFISDFPIQKFKEAAQNLGIDQNIHYIGFLDGIRKYTVLKQSKMLLFPSHHESFGMVALEALACGLPVVAYDLPELREFYGSEMMRCSMTDIKQFSKNILELLENNEQRNNLSRLALTKAQSFNWENTANQILKTLNDI